jgi:hypothetical protein
MKVFIRSDQATVEKPAILGYYPDDASIPDDAHPNAMIVTVPNGVLEMSGGMPRLAKDWRERAGSLPVGAEAKRRIESAFSIHDQLQAIHDVQEAMLTHGPDQSKWPSSARQLKASHDEKWKYVAEVRAKAQEHATALPNDPSSDKIWPRRLTK